MSAAVPPAPTVLAEGNFLIPDATFLAELVAFIIIVLVFQLSGVNGFWEK